MQIGPYEVLGELGRGGMGTVYRARRTDLDREFAVKVLQLGEGSGAAADPRLVARFAREGRSAAALAGTAGIVAVHDVGEFDDGGHTGLYLVMDLVQGRALEQWIENEALEPSHAARWIAQVARAVEAAHDHGILHRDLKPGNILIHDGPGGGPVVTDFGLAGFTQLDGDWSRLTKSGEVFGTVAYMPPEQARGEAVDVTADVYALGATLYECCVGAPPFDRASAFATMLDVLHTPPPMAPLRHAGVPQDLQTIIATCLEKQPSDRYPTAAALAADLERFVAGDAINARRAGPGRRTWRALRRRPRRTAIAGAVLLTGAGTAAGAWWLSDRADTQAGTTAVVQQQEQRADRATRLVECWYALHRDGLADLQTCADAWRGSPHPPGTVERALARTVTLTERLHDDAFTLPQAWLALATLYAGDDVTGLHELDALASAPATDALSELFVARGHLALWTRDVQLPTVEIDATALTAARIHESPAQRARRRQVEAALARGASDAIWDRIQEASEIRRFVQAAVLLGDGRYAQAHTEFRALRDAPGVEDEAALLAGVAAYLSGQYDTAIRDLTDAVDRGWPLGLETAAFCNMAFGMRSRDNPDEARIALDAAVNLSTGLARIRETDPRPRLMLALILRQRGELLAGIAQDPRPDYRASARALDEATDRGATPSHVHRDRAQLYLADAEVSVRRGRDPSPTLLAALAEAEACLAIEPNSHVAHLSIGNAYSRLAEYRAARGVAVEHTLDQAIAAYNRAIEIHPAPPSLTRRGGALRQRADALAAAGRDPLNDLRAALRDLRAALAEAPTLVEALAHTALVHWSIAEFLTDPTDVEREFESGIAAAGTALRHAPAHHSMHETRGALRYALAERRLRDGRDPGTLLSDAADDLGEAIRLNPSSLGGYVLRANVHSLRANVAQAAGADPAPHVAAAMADFTAALTRAPGNVDALYNRAVLQLETGDATRKRGGDAGPAYHAALADFTRCTELAPKAWQAHAGCGSAHGALGNGGDALRAFEAALRLNPTAPGLREAIARLRAREPLGDGSK